MLWFSLYPDLNCLPLVTLCPEDCAWGLPFQLSLGLWGRQLADKPETVSLNTIIKACNLFNMSTLFLAIKARY